MATSRLSLGNEVVEFQARFSGVAQQISIPVGNVSAVYARETGQGMAFEVTRAPARHEEDGGEGLERQPSVPPRPAVPRHERQRPPSCSRVPLCSHCAAAPGAADRAASIWTVPPKPPPVRPAERRRALRLSTDRPEELTARKVRFPRARRRRIRASAPARGQGSADVLAFAPSGDSARRRAGVRRLDPSRVKPVTDPTRGKRRG
jgi:hypothetical protein